VRVRTRHTVGQAWTAVVVRIEHAILAALIVATLYVVAHVVAAAGNIGLN
jgi:hypothetical protein